MGSKVDLTNAISQNETYALNMSQQYPVSNLFNPDSRFQLRSDADDQLIIHFAFTEKVRLSGLIIEAPEGDMRPTGIKLFSNRLNMGFEDATSVPSSFEMELEEDDTNGKTEIALKVVKFTGVDSVTMFVEASEGGDVVALSSVKFLGSTLAGTNMNDLKPSG